MGFFNKKPIDKVYSLKQAIDFINKNPNHTVIETTGGYKIISDNEAREKIDRYKEKTDNFGQRISENGMYKNISSVPQYMQNYKKNQYNEYTSVER